MRRRARARPGGYLWRARRRAAPIRHPPARRRRLPHPEGRVPGSTQVPADRNAAAGSLHVVQGVPRAGYARHLTFLIKTLPPEGGRGTGEEVSLSLSLGWPPWEASAPPQQIAESEDDHDRADRAEP